MGREASSVRERFSRRDAASMVLMLWPCVARMRKCDGSVSDTLSAFSVAVSWPAVVVGVTTELGSSGTVPTPRPSFFVGVVVAVVMGSVALLVVVLVVVVGVSWLTDGTCSKANRFLSDSATALRISGKVTLRDLSFRQESWCIIYLLALLAFPLAA